MKLTRFGAILLLLAGICASAHAQSTPPALIGRLALNKSHIVFSYAGDLWSVPRQGGEAMRLTSDAAEESFPAFSPDGTQLAFARISAGGADIYVMPANGGQARRITWHPRNEYPLAWSPDGTKILFRGSESGAPRLYTIRLDQAHPVELPFSEALEGAFAANGKRIAVAPNSGIGDWRFYRGGGFGRIWIANTASWDIENISPGPYNDEFPVWIGDVLYFISDRSGIFNLFSYNPNNKKTAQLTAFEKYGIRFLTASAGEIAFVRDGRIHLYDIATAKDSIIRVVLNGAASELAPRVGTAARAIESVSLNVSGDQVVVGARGDVFIIDQSTGAATNLTNTSGIAERYPAFSPDGRSVAYFSDQSGEYQLHIRSVKSDGPPKAISIEPKPSFYRELTWSPDGTKLAFSDKRLSLWIADVAASTAARIDSSTYSYQEEWYPRWSPDGKWLTYAKHLRNRIRTVFVYDVTSRKAIQITDGLTHSEQPCFDASGDYLYFVSSPNAGTTEFGWGVLNGVLARPLVTRRLHAALLRPDAEAPLLPNGQPNPRAKLEQSTSVSIDFENIGRRIIDLPTPARDFGSLAPGRPGTLFVVVNEWPVLPSPLAGGPQQVAYVLDLAKAPRLEKLVETVSAFEPSLDGARLLYLKRGSWYVVPSGTPAANDQGKLDFNKLEVRIEPSAEWRQIYHEAWRIMRDWFYDPSYHGLDLRELEAHYAEYLPTITRRSDLNALLNRALGHVSVSHFGVGGGDLPPQPGATVRVGLLGADYEVDSGRYRFKKIYRAATYNSPVGSVEAPLDRPGVSVRQGEYLIAVDDNQVTADKSIYSFFEGKGPGAVKLVVGPSPDGNNSRTITVYPTGNESALRLANWAERNRRTVDEASSHQLGYIYCENYGGGIQDFIRGLTGYSDRAGIIIDQRFNGGGITPDYLIEWLLRRPVYYYTFREGDDIATPVNPGPATRVLIVNEQNFSAAETFAFMYKLARVGPIVGRRTGGGGIGPYVFTPQLLDGGRVRLPNRAAYNPDGSSWGVENAGVNPDYDVEITPHDVLNGRDPQLERAIEVALEEIKKNKPFQPVKPKYPIHPK